MAIVSPWAAGKFRPDGTTIAASACSCAKTGTGTYDVTLDATIGKTECCPTITPWFSSGAPVPVTFDATMPGDGAVINVRFFDLAGAAIDSGFCIVVDRIA